MFKTAKLYANRMLRALPFAAVIGATALASMPAEAQWHHRGYGPRIGFYFGPGYYAPPPYYYGYGPSYYGPPVVVSPPAPPVYIEQTPAPLAAPQQAAPAPASSWYYCADSRSYYPYVKECPGGWQQVAPAPSR
jgi:hypothetical protein